MPLNDTAKNLMLNALAGVAVYASLHNGDPGAGGANEISGGSPAYARKAITWNSAATHNLDSSNQPVFDVPAGTTVMYVGYWSAVTAGTFYGSMPLTNEAYAGQGTYTLTDADVALNDA